MPQFIAVRGAVVRRMVASVVIVIGVALVLTPVVLSLFGRVSSAATMVDGVSPAMTPQALRATQQDLDTLRNAVGQLQNSAVPQAASRLGMSPQQLTGRVSATFPDVAAGLVQFPRAAADAQSIITSLTDNRTKFDSAAGIPMRGLAPRASSWMFVIAGAVLILAGLAALWLPSLGFGLALVVGALLAILPLATSLPAKANDAADLVAVLRAPLSAAGAAHARAEADAIDRMFTQTRTQVLPWLAQQLGMTPAQLDSSLAQEAPLLAHGMPRVDAGLASLVAQANALGGEVSNYTDTAAIPLRSIPWLFVVPGIVVLVISGVALWARPRSRVLTGSRSPRRRVAEPAEEPAAASPPAY